MELQSRKNEDFSRITSSIGQFTQQKTQERFDTFTEIDSNNSVSLIFIMLSTNNSIESVNSSFVSKLT